MRDITQLYLHVSVDDAEVVEVAEGEHDFRPVEARARLRECAALLDGGRRWRGGVGGGDSDKSTGEIRRKGTFRQVFNDF